MNSPYCNTKVAQITYCKEYARPNCPMTCQFATETIRKQTISVIETMTEKPLGEKRRVLQL